MCNCLLCRIGLPHGTPLAPEVEAAVTKVLDEDDSRWREVNEALTEAGAKEDGRKIADTIRQLGLNLASAIAWAKKFEREVAAARAEVRDARLDYEGLTHDYNHVADAIGEEDRSPSGLVRQVATLRERLASAEAEREAANYRASHATAQSIARAEENGTLRERLAEVERELLCAKSEKNIAEGRYEGAQIAAKAHLDWCTSPNRAALSSPPAPSPLAQENRRLRRLFGQAVVYWREADRMLAEGRPVGFVDPGASKLLDQCEAALSQPTASADGRCDKCGAPDHAGDNHPTVATASGEREPVVADMAAVLRDHLAANPEMVEPPSAWSDRMLAGTLLSDLWRIYDAGGISDGRSHEATLLEAARDLLNLPAVGVEFRPDRRALIDEAQRRRLLRPLRTASGEREEAKGECGDVAPPGPGPDPLPSLCSLPLGHDGDHEEHVGGKVRRWAKTAPPPSPAPTLPPDVLTALRDRNVEIPGEAALLRDLLTHPRELLLPVDQFVYRAPESDTPPSPAPTAPQHNADDEGCLCGTGPAGHAMGEHPDCEMYLHHCDHCHGKGFCTAPACVTESPTQGGNEK
jgi:hypothetical protein